MIALLLILLSAFFMVIVGVLYSGIGNGNSAQINQNSTPKPTEDYKWSDLDATLKPGFHYFLTIVGNDGYFYTSSSYVTSDQYSPIHLSNTTDRIIVSGAEMSLTAYCNRHRFDNEVNHAVITIIPTTPMSLSVSIRDGTAELGSLQVDTPTVTPTPQPTEQIMVSYSTQTFSKLYPYGYHDGTANFVDTPKAGNKFLMVNVTVTNHGYLKFDTYDNMLRFHVVADNIQYDFDAETFIVNQWDSVDILNGGSFKGVLVFQIPETATNYSLTYENGYPRYNVVLTQK